MNDKESQRLAADARRERNWKRWGPYLSERQWATVREDYSADGSCWDYFPHDHARSRAYRWGEDGILGITDRQCRLCFALALWNGNDPILKERLFGLTNAQGNHGEDVKELYYYLDSTPTHSYMKGLYKYPQARFPYERLVHENGRLGNNEPEFELVDTGIFDGNRYFDVYVEYAKASDNDVLIQITVCNRADGEAVLHLLPTLWFRNSWIWGCQHEGCTLKPIIKRKDKCTLHTKHETLGEFIFAIDPDRTGKNPEVLFTENETNTLRLFGVENYTKYTKDAFGEYVIHGKKDAISDKQEGTKAAAYYKLRVPGNGRTEVKMRLCAKDENVDERFGEDFEKVFENRIAEADEFYARTIPGELADESRAVVRQAYAGLLWSKQFYHYVVRDWLTGDLAMPPPVASRKTGRNNDWPHLFNRDVISMPDKWEYPWYASWDLAFHMISFAKIDPDFAKKQLILFLREWYMHPNGQIPAYEYSFSDVNPPVHAWACWRVYKMTGPRGKRDRKFLESAFQKLLLNFAWWVNRKDLVGRHIFSGGFLGLDNIGVFDRSKPLPNGGYLNQADGTAWMAFYCGTMLSMALELAQHEEAYEDMASKFFEHFLHISDAMNSLGGTGLWNSDDGFYYDELRIGNEIMPLKLRSLVGLIPLIAVEIVEHRTIANLHGFTKRSRWFMENRKDLTQHISFMNCSSPGDPNALYMLGIPCEPRLRSVLRYLLDENEFLSPFGIRSLSKVYKDNPFSVWLGGREHRVEYLPGESNTDLFGGNSNWRGPIWFPINYLIIEALQRYDHFYKERLQVEFPTGSGTMMTLGQVARELSQRLTKIFLADELGHRPLHGGVDKYATDENWRDLVLFNEYFHGETGQGLGASHQTGWTALITRCFEELAATSHIEIPAESKTLR
ncbi:MAG: MGH1-like glycoside hydrolase domain-containing protein [Planctomycetota bacterium]